MTKDGDKTPETLRLSVYLARAGVASRRGAGDLVKDGLVEVNGQTETNPGTPIRLGIDHVRVDGKSIKKLEPHVYLMLNKPAGIVSATADKLHCTVIDLLEQPWKDELHIVGRLDFNSTGLVLLTNDGQWSRRLSLPGSKLLKRYRVRVEKALNEDHVEAFRRGLYFKYEGVTTRPAQLIMLSEFEAEVGLVEGRYHQIKRMFGQCDNRVLSIHRFAVGSLRLDAALAPGQSRELTPAELAALSQG